MPEINKRFDEFERRIVDLEQRIIPKNEFHSLIKLEKEEFKITLEDTLLKFFGFDPSEASEVRKDAAYTRRQRITAEKLSLHVKTVLIGIAIASAVGAVLVGFVEKIKEMLH